MFGVAKEKKTALEQAGLESGTPDYSSPLDVPAPSRWLKKAFHGATGGVLGTGNPATAVSDHSTRNLVPRGYILHCRLLYREGTTGGSGHRPEFLSQR